MSMLGHQLCASESNVKFSLSLYLVSLLYLALTSCFSLHLLQLCRITQERQEGVVSDQ